MYLLDTNIISEMRRKKPHGAVKAWLEATDDRDLHLSAVTLGEIQAGIERTRDVDADRAEELSQWADAVAATFNILSMDAATFRLWARLMHHKPDSLYEDAMIAATAIAHGLTVVTRNVKDFAALNVELFNPFAAKNVS
ncbi:type II toxin-antitoxin system VapC family toxin [Sphingomonas oligophenolica]|uniref:Ribonuclease VapC n=1 Tax=Sphingomonas oligophenolica TaxID=301154 RepID=A0ABU9Y343_9SPHN